MSPPEYLDGLRVMKNIVEELWPPIREGSWQHPKVLAPNVQFDPSDGRWMSSLLRGAPWLSDKTQGGIGTHMYPLGAGSIPLDQLRDKIVRRPFDVSTGAQSVTRRASEAFSAR